MSKLGLTPELEAVAKKSIGEFAKLETSKASKELRTNLSAHLLTIAKAAFEAGKMEKGAEVWAAMCRFAEKDYSEAHTGKDNKPIAVSILLPSWRVYKAQISAGINAKLNPVDFKTVYDLQKATPKKARKPSGQTGEKAGPKVSANLGSAAEGLWKVLGTVPPELEAAAIEVLTRATADIGTIVEGKEKEKQLAA
jgi:hypothetical protein